MNQAGQTPPKPRGASEAWFSGPAYRRLCTFIHDFPWIHMWLSVIGGLLFFVGSILFLIGGVSRTVGTGLFVVGSLGMFIGSAGQLIKEHITRKLHS